MRGVRDRLLRPRLRRYRMCQLRAQFERVRVPVLFDHGIGNSALGNGTGRAVLSSSTASPRPIILPPPPPSAISAAGASIGMIVPGSRGMRRARHVMSAKAAWRRGGSGVGRARPRRRSAVSQARCCRNSRSLLATIVSLPRRRPCTSVPTRTASEAQATSRTGLLCVVRARTAHCAVFVDTRAAAASSLPQFTGSSPRKTISRTKPITITLRSRRHGVSGVTR